MQFKHPELLYALFLLLIPILIHLFQLRRFQKVAFTNVSFLKKVTLQTRKSSQLKKWLTLLLRLLAFAAIILAFAQPFSASKTALNTDKETVIYIDNSFSMQAKGTNGPLLKRSLQQLYEKASSSNKITWFTNNIVKKEASIQDFKNDILKVDYSEKQLSLSDVVLKANQLFSKNTDKESGVEKRLILISDFQKNGEFPSINTDIKVNAVPLKPIQSTNISIDTAYIFKKKITGLDLKVQISVQGDVPKNIPVSLYNNDLLIAKSSVNFDKEIKNIESKTITFSISDTDIVNGKIEITDPNLIFDNILYFNINKTHKIKVLALNGENSNYLQRIFNQEEFILTQQKSTNLNYSDFNEQNLIVLNGLKNIPNSLSTSLHSFSENGGSILIIPSTEAVIEDYNILLNKLSLGTISEKITQEKRISKIVFDHPLFENVFEKKVMNFQYPTVKSYLSINTQASSLIRFEDNKPFIIQNKNNFLCLASINNDNSNFQNSPLIVPTIYNMAKQSLALPKIYYEIGIQNTYAIPVTLTQNEILKIVDSTFSFIPLQLTKAKKVIITTTDKPNKAGIYSIVKEEQYLENVSYNYNRQESVLLYNSPENWQGVSTFKTIDELFTSIEVENTINSYWKWFLIFALLFLILEMLVLKFFKK